MQGMSPVAHPAIEVLRSWRAKHFVHALMIGLGIEVATGMPLRYWAGWETFFNTWLYHSLQFGLPLVFAVRWADRAVDRGARAWLAYSLAVLLTALAGVWPIARLLWPVLGRADWWTLSDDLWLALNVSLVLGLGVGTYAYWRGLRQVGERLAGMLDARDLARRELALTQLRTLQARVDPVLLFDALQRIQSLLPAQVELADARLQSLIVLLRSLLPRVGGGAGSLAGRLGEELMLVERYASAAGLDALAAPRLLVRLGPGAEDARVAPMLLLPLLRRLGGSADAHWLLEAQVLGDRLQIDLSGDEAGGRALRGLSGAWLDELRQRLHAVHGPDARLDLLGRPEDRLRLSLRFEQATQEDDEACRES